MAVRLRERRRNLEARNLQRSKLDQRACEEDSTVIRNQSKILQIETNCVYRQYKERAHLSRLNNLGSQPRIAISSVCVL